MRVFNEGTSTFDEFLNKRLNKEYSISKDYSLELDENNVFKYVNLECIKCNSHIIEAITTD